jgi:hypothetical protein
MLPVWLFEKINWYRILERAYHSLLSLDCPPGSTMDLQKRFSAIRNVRRLFFVKSQNGPVR